MNIEVYELEGSRLMQPESTAALSKPVLSKRLILVMSIAAGLAVANLYYGQPLLNDMRMSFHTASWRVGVAATLTQVGYACGLFLFVPLGDSHERRRLIVRMSIAAACALVFLAATQNIGWLYTASLAVGVTTVVPQMIVPFAAHLAAPAERGKVVGTVMSGLLIGILLARTLSGFVGSQLGWRAMYFIAAAIMILLAIILQWLLPALPSEAETPYGQLLRSLFTLIRQLPDLRDASLLGAMSFAAFSVFWTVLSLYLAGPPFHLGADVAGLLGLAGVAGAMIAPAAGSITSRIPAPYASRLATCVTLLSFLILWLFRQHLIGLIVGAVVMDLGVQATQVSNQARIYGLSEAARSRLNTVYMVTYFLGGALGSFVGSFVFDRWHWAGVCAAASILLLIGILGFLAVAPKSLMPSQNRHNAIN
ncbi:major facilitator transporter [Alicyclobacillus sacchari]|uniref:MFS transporter n=1 Tax=Alicyclobacillus sacchari TaxID=392010 RepID=UPI0023E9766F|nr:MFS transporter [Alicyclobacillus sacchari]GMA57796.1 major facilitator transporter [Alicyclobacillus sacchari]